MLDPKLFTDTLQKKYNFKLKGTGLIDFHLGQSFSRNDDGEIEISAKCYIDKMIDTYVQHYGEKPRKALSPLEQNDHPEIYNSPFLGQDETQQFQSLIGAMQWAVSIDRLDITTAVMSLSSFCAMPRRFLNQTPMNWYSKKQATVGTATFGSEFITARTTIDQIVDLQMTLRYLGVPIREKSYVFGDNKTVIDASSTPHAKLHKRHNALSFHRV
jgi:hypothetical protein